MNENHGCISANKGKIIDLHENTTKTVRDIGKDYGCSHSAVVKILKYCEQIGDVDVDQKNVLKKSKKIERERRTVLRFSRKNLKILPNQVCTDLSLDVSTHTVRRTLF